MSSAPPPAAPGGKRPPASDANANAGDDAAKKRRPDDDLGHLDVDAAAADDSLAHVRTDVDDVLAAGGTRIPASGAGHGCLHDVVYPPDWRPNPKARAYDPSNPAKHYKFELDTFQRKSVEVMERARA